jgi:hypothetical protein
MCAFHVDLPSPEGIPGSSEAAISRSFPQNPAKKRHGAQRRQKTRLTAWNKKGTLRLIEEQSLFFHMVINRQSTGQYPS